MAVTPSLLDSGVTNNLAGASGTTTASVAPTANALVLVSVSVAYDSTPSGWSGNNGTTTRNVFTLTGNGLTYVRIGSMQYGDRRCTELFRAMGASPSSGAISIAASNIGGGGAVRDIAWIAQEFTGVVTTGSNGEDAVGALDDNFTTGATSLALSLAGTPATDDLSFGHISEEGAVTVTRETNYTLIANVDASDNVRRLQSIYRDAAADVTPSWSWSGSNSAAALGCLIKAGAGGGGGALPWLFRNHTHTQVVHI